MAKMDNSEDINVRRDCVPSCLSIDLNEDLDTLVKQYVDIECREAEADVAGTTMGIYTVRADGGRFADVKKDEAVIKEKMQRTFSLRRQKILQEPKIPEFLNKCPALFDFNEINLEFLRLYL
ncbi:hypothetical protein CesoFtcFv8_022260 [Champsocephalus esox]|uniref:Uncharacterized protein n=1 Tax=Champsocephalus esox TaxID=159716 RepID=A0AAN8GJY0_9TELE|nr:hypothetical protein CesoFtcFv8_022260 [Champsocephalus esox]